MKEHERFERMAALLNGREQKLLKRIAVDRKILGKPITRNQAIRVEEIIGRMAADESVDSILAQYPGLEPEDILACLGVARRLIKDEPIERVLDAAFLVSLFH